MGSFFQGGDIHEFLAQLGKSTLANVSHELSGTSELKKRHKTVFVEDVEPSLAAPARNNNGGYRKAHNANNHGSFQNSWDGKNASDDGWNSNNDGWEPEPNKGDDEVFARNGWGTGSGKNENGSSAEDGWGADPTSNKDESLVEDGWGAEPSINKRDCLAKNGWTAGPSENKDGSGAKDGWGADTSLSGAPPDSGWDTQVTESNGQSQSGWNADQNPPKMRSFGGNGDASERRSGRFGPSGSNTVVLGKRREFKAKDGWGAASSKNNDGWGAKSSFEMDGSDGKIGWDTEVCNNKDGDGWGAGPGSNNDAGGWGAEPSSNKDGDGWGTEPSSNKNGDGWDAEPSSNKDGDGWGAEPSSNKNGDGWGAEPSSNRDEPFAKNGWGSDTQIGGDSTPSGWGKASKNNYQSHSGWNTAQKSPNMRGAGGDNDDDGASARRRNGRFGPSGSNTVALGKQRVFQAKHKDESSWANEWGDTKSTVKPDGSCANIGWDAEACSNKDVDGWGAKACSSSKDEDGWGAETCSKGGWGTETVSKEDDDGWGAEPSMNKNASSEKNGWGADTSIDGGTPAESGWGTEVTETNHRSDSGWNNTERKAPSRFNKRENGGADERRSGRFGPSGSNCVALGKQRGFRKEGNRESGRDMEENAAGNEWGKKEKQDTASADDGWGDVAAAENPTVEPMDGWGDEGTGDRKNAEPMDGWGNAATGENSNAKSSGGWESTDHDSDANQQLRGAFGPSGMNKVPLGKRRNAWEGGENQNRNQRNAEGTNKSSDDAGWGDDGENKHANGWTSGASNDRATRMPYKDNMHRPRRRDWQGENRDPRQAPNRRRPIKGLLGTSLSPELDELQHLCKKILHYSEYKNGDRLNPDDQEFLLEKVVVHHPAKDEKLGCGVDHVMIDAHPEHEAVCFFLVRKDGSKADFSYWKCLQGMLETKYPELLKEQEEKAMMMGKAASEEKSGEAVVDEKRGEGAVENQVEVEGATLEEALVGGDTLETLLGEATSVEEGGRDDVFHDKLGDGWIL